MIERIKELPVLGMIAPKNPMVMQVRDASGNPTRITIDMKTHQFLQKQRLAYAFVGGPVIMYAGWKTQLPWYGKAGVIGLGALYSLQNLIEWSDFKNLE